MIGVTRSIRTRSASCSAADPGGAVRKGSRTGSISNSIQGKLKSYHRDANTDGRAPSSGETRMEALRDTHHIPTLVLPWSRGDAARRADRKQRALARSSIRVHRHAVSDDGE